MNFKDKLIKVYDECMSDLYLVADEDEKAEYDLMKQRMLHNLIKENVSEAEEKFINDNIDLYKQLIRATLSEEGGDEKSIKIIIGKLLECKNNINNGLKEY